MGVIAWTECPRAFAATTNRLVLSDNGARERMPSFIMFYSEATNTGGHARPMDAFNQRFCGDLIPPQTTWRSQRTVNAQSMPNLSNLICPRLRSKILVHALHAGTAHRANPFPGVEKNFPIAPRRTRLECRSESRQDTPRCMPATERRGTETPFGKNVCKGSKRKTVDFRFCREHVWMSR